MFFIILTFNFPLLLKLPFSTTKYKNTFRDGSEIGFIEFGKWLDVTKMFHSTQSV